MKKFCVFLLSLSFFIFLASCNSNGPSNERTSDVAEFDPLLFLNHLEQVPAANDNETASVTIDGITYQMVAELLPMKGPLHKAPVMQDDAYYFMWNGQILDADQYYSLTATITIQNSTDQPFGYSFAFSHAQLQTGTGLTQKSNPPDLSLNVVPPHYCADVILEYPVAKGPGLEEITITFPHMDYNQIFWEDYRNLEQAQLSPEELANKYQDHMTPIALTAAIAG